MLSRCSKSKEDPSKPCTHRCWGSSGPYGTFVLRSSAAQSPETEVDDV